MRIINVTGQQVSKAFLNSNMRVLIIDNYDSFTYNLLHIVEQYVAEVFVFRNDEIPLDSLDAYDKILLSPGPGLPEEAGDLMKLLDLLPEKTSLLGICLGCQAIALHFGSKLYNLDEVQHGVRNTMYVCDRKDPLLKNVPDSFSVGRYHSWAVRKEGLSLELKVSGTTADGTIMSLYHEKKSIYGIQYHPESIMSEYGKLLIKNWLML